jgi:hypothetical protein
MSVCVTNYERIGNRVVFYLIFDQLDRSFEGRRSITWSQEIKEHLTHNQTKEGYCIGHIFRRNCVVKHVAEGRIEGTRRL